MSKKTNKRRPRVSSTHTHEEPQQRQPRAQSVIRVQQQKISHLEDLHVGACAIVEDLTEENRGLLAMMQQIVAENQILRTRLGYVEGEPIELSDEEAAKSVADGAKVFELPDREGQTPDGTKEARQSSGSTGEAGGEEPVQDRGAGSTDHVGDPEADQGSGS